MPDTATPRQRMPSPVSAVPDALKALLALGETAKGNGVPPATTMLIALRASQINGCSFCTEMHARELKEAGESEERIWAVGAWREAPYFSDAERAALALAEEVTRLSDRPDPVPDKVWEEAARHYDEQALAGLLLQIALINVWNRVNVPIRQPAGASWS